MTEPIKMTKWQAKMNGIGTIFGGINDPLAVNVSAVIPELVSYFIVSDSSNPSVAMYILDGVEKWYRGGKAFSPVFPLVFSLQDGSTLMIERNSGEPGDLMYTQA